MPRRIPGASWLGSHPLAVAPGWRRGRRAGLCQRCPIRDHRYLEAHRTRETEAGWDWQGRVARAARLVTVKYGIPGLKYAMELNGYYGGNPRLPLVPVGAEARKEIGDAFEGVQG